MPGLTTEVNSVDVLVVGAGPTGLSLAGELLRYGLSVRLARMSSSFKCTSACHDIGVYVGAACNATVRPTRAWE